MKSLLLFIMFALSLTINSQSVISTIGSNGTFSIKDGTTTYFTLTQTSGEVNILKNLRVENTTGLTAGVIFKGTERFIHNYGSSNSFFGVNAGNFALTGTNNTGLGYNSLFTNTSGSENTATGYNTLYMNTTGSKNTASGNLALFNNNIGTNNAGFGYNSLYYNSSGTDNTAIGYLALFNNSTASQNTSIGSQSLYSNNTGTQNTALGVNAGFSVTTGTNLTIIGFNSSPSTGTATNQVTLGNSSVTVLRCNTSTITTLSDERDKKNITDITLGLDFITKYHPGSLTGIKESGMTIMYQMAAKCLNCLQRDSLRRSWTLSSHPKTQNGCSSC